MSKLKCVEHNRRVHVWDDGLGAVTVHRNDGTRCIVNPLVKINGGTYMPSAITSMTFSWKSYWMSGFDIQAHYKEMN